MPLDDQKPTEQTKEPPKQPESPIALPRDPVRLLQTAMEIVETCTASAGMRAAYARQINTMVETGTSSGSRSLINKLYSHLDRLASHLFSPSALRFVIDFENLYNKEILDQAKMASRTLTRSWERNNTDMEFGQGVFEGLKYGASIMKQWPQNEGDTKTPVYYKSLVMPWQFGVWREDISDLSRQPAMVETVMLSMPEVWRRIYHLPNAHDLFKRIQTHSNQGGQADENSSMFHYVLNVGQLNTSGQSPTRPTPGGIVQLSNNPSYGIMAPNVTAPMAKMREIWAWDEDDYVTIQIIEPDILIAPRFRPQNLLIGGDEPSGLHPYTLIQPNKTHGYFWGRSELVDLVEPQELLSMWASDIRRLFGLQIDKILAFAGFDGVTDETYDQMRAAGFFSGTAGATVSDLTPKFPAEAVPLLNLIMQVIDNLGGFDNILDGRGQQGVRSGVQTDSLMKTASPRLRDRSLLVERQCAAAADLSLSIMEAKDGSHYWTDANKQDETRFLLADLPEDRRVSVDSHSSSPIFADDHQNLIGFGVKAGFLDGEDAIEELPFPNKDLMIQRLRERQAKQQMMMEKLAKENPEAFAKLMAHKGGKH